MDWRKVMRDYEEIFKESTEIPWDGFPDEKTEREYLETLQACIDTGKPLTPEQRTYFFPLEHSKKFLKPDVVY